MEWLLDKTITATFQYLCGLTLNSKHFSYLMKQGGLSRQFMQTELAQTA
jgi:hypothetical protein